ncbi:hypothetical protein D3C77_477070 [compost metagenome]
MDVQAAAQMRQEHGAQGAVIDRELRRGLGPGHAKAQEPAFVGGNIRAHHVVDVLLAAVHLEVRALFPLARRHDVVDGKYDVLWLVVERSVGLRVGHVDDLALAFDVAGNDHYGHVRLIRNPQDQGDVVGLEGHAQVFQGARQGFGIERTVIDVTHQTVVVGKVQAQCGQYFMSQHGSFHSRLLARVRPDGLPFYCYCFDRGASPVQPARCSSPRQ